MNPLMIERNMEKNESKQHSIEHLHLFNSILSRHNIIELIETEKEYVKDLALIVEVRIPFESIISNIFT